MLSWVNENWGFSIPQKMKFSIKDFFRKCDQIRNFLVLRSSVLVMESFVRVVNNFWLFVDNYFHEKVPS